MDYSKEYDNVRITTSPVFLWDNKEHEIIPGPPEVEDSSAHAIPSTRLDDVVPNMKTIIEKHLNDYIIIYPNHGVFDDNEVYSISSNFEGEPVIMVRALILNEKGEEVKI